MRGRIVGMALLMTVAGCGTDGSGPDASLLGRERGGATLLEGQVLGVTPGPDSVVAPVDGAQVVVLYVGPIPPDTGGAPPPQGDTMLFVSRGMAFPLLDSIPVDPVPTDTIPPDSNPPPPVIGCGRPSDTVATLVTTRNGRFQIAALQEGVYDLQASPPAGSGFGTTFACGVFLRAGDPAQLTVYVPAISGSLAAP